jgi:hypothetical protein
MRRRRLLSHPLFIGWVAVVGVSTVAQEWIRRAWVPSASWIPVVALVAAAAYTIRLTCWGASFGSSLRRLAGFSAAWWLALWAMGAAAGAYWPHATPL